MLAASNDLYANEMRDKVWPKMSTLQLFVQSFDQGNAEGIAAAVGAGDSQDAQGSLDSDGVCSGLTASTIDAFAQFHKELLPASQGIAAILAQVHRGEFDDEFLEIASAEVRSGTFSFAWQELFGQVGAGPGAKAKAKVVQAPAAEVTQLAPRLQAACSAWIDMVFAAQQTTASSAVGDADRVMTATTDESVQQEAETERAKTLSLVDGMLAKDVKFVHVPAATGARPISQRIDSVVKNGSGFFFDSRAQSQATKPPPEPIRMYYMSAELFPSHEKWDQHDKIPIGSNSNGAAVAQEFRDCVKWAAVAKQAKDVLCVADGRNEKARKAIREVLSSSAVSDSVIEVWVIYEVEGNLATDVRNPKRKRPWSGANMEVLFVALPKPSTRAKGKLIPRESFCTGGGEVTNFCRTYTRVPFRNLHEIPRVDSDQKQRMFGDVPVQALPRDRMQKEVEAHGHPMFWAEWKPIALYSAFFRDWCVNEVVDLTPGSGAAAVGALYSNNVKYLGVAWNEAHMKWLQKILQMTFVSLLHTKAIKKKELDHDVADVQQQIQDRLKRTAELAAKWLPQNQGPSAVGNCFQGDDDSDVDDEDD